MIEPDAMNGTVTIRRPRRAGPAGDTDPANDLVVASGLAAHHEHTHRVQRDGKTGTDIVVSGVFLLDPLLPGGAPLEVRERDYLVYTDTHGRVSQALTAVSVSYVHVGSELDHIEIDV